MNKNAKAKSTKQKDQTEHKKKIRREPAEKKTNPKNLGTRKHSDQKKVVIQTTKQQTTHIKTTKSPLHPEQYPKKVKLTCLWTEQIHEKFKQGLLKQKCSQRNT